MTENREVANITDVITILVSFSIKNANFFFITMSITNTKVFFIAMSMTMTDVFVIRRTITMTYVFVVTTRSGGFHIGAIKARQQEHSELANT